MERIFLDNTKPLVSAVTEWLAAQMRVTPGGVKSLSHLLVIVPTGCVWHWQSSRVAVCPRSYDCPPK